MRAIVAVVLSCSLVLALAGPVAAAKPARSCPNEKFELMTYEQFRALSVSVGVPEDVIAPESAWHAVDKNGDGALCVMDLPDTPGTLDGWIFNVVDNTANR